MKKECETCIKRKTPYCPTSIECMATDDMPYYQNRIMLLEENQQLKDLIDTILNFSFFKEECPLNFGFENNTNEDKSQSIFYEDEWCENNCNDNYKECWLKYFKKLQELEQGSDK